MRQPDWDPVEDHLTEFPPPGDTKFAVAKMPISICKLKLKKKYIGKDIKHKEIKLGPRRGPPNGVPATGG